MGMFGIGGKKPLSQSQRDQLMASIAPQIGQAQAPSIMQTAPIESGMMQAPSMGDPQKIKPHFMDKGSTSRGLLFGALGGALDGVAQYGGSQPGFANTMRQNEALALEETKYQRERKDTLSDLIAKLELEQKYKVPERTAFENNLRVAGIDPQSPEGRQLSRQYVTNQANPLMSAQGYDAQGNPVMNMFPRFPESPQQPQAPQSPDANNDPTEALMFQAQEALRKGAPYDAVMRRLNEQINAMGGQ